MKIAMVFDGLGYGGVERVGIDYVRLMLEMGHEVQIYNLNPKLSDMVSEVDHNVKIFNYSFSKKLCPENYEHLSKKYSSGKYIYPFISLFLSLSIIIRRFFFQHKYKEFDLVIAFSGHINDLNFVYHNFVKSKKKIAWLHGCLAQYLLLSTGFGHLYRGIRNLVVLSSYGDKMAMLGNQFLNSINMKKIYNPTYISRREIDFKKVDGLKKKYGNFLLMIGRFDEDKDQISVVKSLKMLQDKYNLRLNLIFVGDGSNKESVEQLVEELNLEDYVTFIGSILDVQNYYKAAHVFVHSSPSEGLPTVIIEALYYELPIVSSNSLPGVPEILGDETYGLIYGVGDINEMTDKIFQMYNDKKLHSHYSEKSLSRYEDFRPERIKKDLSVIIENNSNST